MDAETKEAIGNLQGKVDQILETLHMLARVEERQAATAVSVDQINQRINGHSERIRNLEISAGASNVRVSWLDRLLWLALGSAAACVPLLLNLMASG